MITNLLSGILKRIHGEVGEEPSEEEEAFLDLLGFSFFFDAIVAHDGLKVHFKIVLPEGV